MKKFAKIDNELEFQTKTLKEVTSLMSKTTKEFGNAVHAGFTNNSILTTFEENFNRVNKMENHIERQMAHNRLLHDLFMWFKILSDSQIEMLSILKYAFDNLENGNFNNDILSFETISHKKRYKQVEIWKRVDKKSV